MTTELASGGGSFRGSTPASNAEASAKLVPLHLGLRSLPFTKDH